MGNATGINPNTVIREPCVLPLEEQVTPHNKRSFYKKLATTSKALPYEEVREEPDLPLFRDLYNDHHKIGGLDSQMHKQARLAELEYENDCYLKSYLKSGILYGFKIMDDCELVQEYDNKNYSSVYSKEAKDVINEIITSELAEEKYILTDSKPKCIHSLGAVPKSGGGFRPITDCSRPQNASVNSYMMESSPRFTYQTVDYITELMQPNDFSTTVDIASAYRSVSIYPEHRKYQGIRWQIDGEEKYLLDTRLCFGIKSAPFIFTQISNFIVRAMHRRGFFKIANYLDDYVIFDESFDSCIYAQSVLVHLLISLGFAPAWKKCSAPSRCTRYLGIIFDSVNMELRLPEDKLYKLREELTFFQNKKRVTKKQIQKLAGYLAHCSKVVRGGRLFSRRIISLLKGLNDKKRVRLPKSAREDIDWWSAFMTFFNGSATIIKYNYGHGPTIWTDACMTGYGVFANDDWQAGLFDSSLPLADLVDNHGHWVNVNKNLVMPQVDNINYWELVAVWQAVYRLAPRYTNQHIVIASDNTQVVAMLNTNRSVNLSCLELLREIFWISAIYNVYITGRHIPGVQNIIADKLSRLYSLSPIDELRKLCLCCSH